MKRILVAVGLCAALAAPGSALAQAGPPPPPVKALVAADPHLDMASRLYHEAFLQSLQAGGPSGGWFTPLPSGLDPAEFEHCTRSAQDARTCVSRLLAKKQIVGPTVVVLAFGRGADARWLCIGTGPRPTSPDRQSIRFDLDTAVAAVSSPERMETRAAGAGCVMAAAAESGW